MKSFKANYNVIVDGWNCDGAVRMDEAFRKASEWVQMGHTDVAIRELATGLYMKHDEARTDRF